MHIELPIVGGQVLMGTDAPESMGFKMNFGNNIYINLEPDTKDETKKLFDALSAGGKVTMNFRTCFGAHISEAAKIDFGVQWMFNGQIAAS